MLVAEPDIQSEEPRTMAESGPQLPLFRLSRPSARHRALAGYCRCLFRLPPQPHVRVHKIVEDFGLAYVRWQTDNAPQNLIFNAPYAGTSATD